MKTSSSSSLSISRSSNLESPSMSLISSKISNEDSKNKPETETESKVETKGSKHEDRSITETSDQLAKQEQEGQGRSQNEPKQELIQSLNKYVFNTQCGNGQTFNNFPIIVRIPINDKQGRQEIENFVSGCSGISAVYHHQEKKEIDKAVEFFNIGFTTKKELDDLIYKLYQEQIVYELDYSKFISHPGILFIKNLSSNLMFDNNYNHKEDRTEDDYDDDQEETETESITIVESTEPKHKLFEFLMDNSYFKSLQEVKIFNNDNNNISTIPLSSFAIVKFSNHLDVDILIKKYNKYVPNIFNNNTNIPLFLNKYLNRKERFVFPGAPNLANTINNTTNSSGGTSSTGTTTTTNTTISPTRSMDNFNLIIVENLLNFLPRIKLNEEVFNGFINKFNSFGNLIDQIYFPLSDKGANLEEIKTLDFGFIKFKQLGSNNNNNGNTNIMENTLRILYYLNGLTWEEFNQLDVNNLRSFLQDAKFEQRELPSEEEENEENETNNTTTTTNDDDNDQGSNQGKLSITIAQHKHNHYLFAQSNSLYLSMGKDSSISISFPNPVFTINQFSRSLNYQETNIYVNNLPIVFNNDDCTWESFWGQFGIIKSAKIIKPQFYHEYEDDHKSGKIGFVFYKTFKMAIRAILMTNNKVVNVGHYNPIVIQSSFAIQKSNSNKDSKQQQQHNHHNNLSITNPNHMVVGSNNTMAATAAAVAAAATVANQSYYTYQPMLPYYYGYPATPYQFANVLPGPPPPPPPPHPHPLPGAAAGGGSANSVTGDNNRNTAMSAAAATAATTTAYSNYLIPARGYPYYYFKLGVDKSNKE